MKQIKSIAVGLCMLVTMASCTPKMTFSPSSIVPAASGTVNIKNDKNNNYITKVSVMNLAESKNLNPSKNTYLVWMEAADRSVRKLGQLTPAGKTLKGELNTTSVARPDVVFITAEDNAEIQNPEGQLILTTRN